MGRLPIDVKKILALSLRSIVELHSCVQTTQKNNYWQVYCLIGVDLNKKSAQGGFQTFSVQLT